MTGLRASAPARSARLALARLRHRQLLRRLVAPKLLGWFAQDYPRAFFVEVGANDGVQHDHLRPILHSHPWSGIMVEPVPYVFARLQRNYADHPRVILEQAAVADHDGTLPFYHLSPPAASERERLPDWYDGIGSFSRETLLGHADHIPDVEARIVCSEVRCLTLSSLLSRHGAEVLDVLVVDTEGYDWEVVRQIETLPVPPRLLIYEHFHLSPAVRRSCLQFVRELGYEAKEEGFDTLCLSEGAAPGLRRRWHRVQPAVAGVSARDQAP